MNNLSVDGEFRYIVSWFNEWSELQREDFVPVMVEYLTHDAPEAAVYMNGVVHAVAQAELSDKPMSLFQCRIKLFREWSPKWPLEFKHKLKEKIMELDTKVGEKIIDEIKGPNGSSSSPSSHANGSDNGHDNVNANGNGGSVAATSGIAEFNAAAVDHMLNAAANGAGAAIDSDTDNSLAALPNNETSVDVDDTDADADVAAEATATATIAVVAAAADTLAEPAEQVDEMQTQQHVRAAAATVATTVANNSSAEVPLVA